MAALGSCRTLALALGLVLSALPGMGAKSAAIPKSAAPAPVARVAARAASLSGASPLRPGAIATGELRLIGLHLQAPGTRIDVPQGAPFTVPVTLMLGTRAATPAEVSQLVPAGAQLAGTLSGPSISTQDLTGTVASGLNVPSLPAIGDYTVSDIKLVSGTITIMQADPPAVAIRCLGEVIISTVTSTPMTKQEILDSGIQLGQGDYQARRFSMTLTLGGNSVGLSVPIAIPIYNGLESPDGEPPLVGKLEYTGLADSVPDLSVSVVDILPDASLTLNRPEVAHLLTHSFKGLVVIPGSIGYLHQFYKTNLVILNVLPDGSPYVVQNLKATLMPPPGADGAVGTSDDPLVAVPSGAESADLVKQILTADQSPSLKAGETGSALWYLEGERLGDHEIKFYIQGEFAGGTLAAPIPITGTARGKILVRNPSFDLMLVHPDVVRRFETYTLEARLTNTSQTLANDVSITLDRARLANVTLVGEATQTVATLNPGETAIMKFQLKALRDGEITSSYLYMEEGSIGFQLTTGLGERLIKLNPDTLVLPQTLDSLPAGLREAMLRVLGQAHSIATTKGTLPLGVLPISSNTVQQTIPTALTENGLFLKMGVDKVRIWADLWRVFTRSDDLGFDQLMRTTDAGNALRTAFLDSWNTWAKPGSPLTDSLPLLSSLALEHQLPVMAAVQGLAPGVALGLVDGTGQGAESNDPLPILTTAGTALGVKDLTGLVQMPFSVPGVRLALSNQGATDQDVTVAVASPLADTTKPASLNTYTLHLAGGASAFVDLGVTRAPLVTLNPPSSSPTQITPSSTSDVLQEPFQVLAVHRYDLELSPDATPFGTQVMVLFNRPNQSVDIPWSQPGIDAAQALVSVEANHFWKKAMPLNGDGTPGTSAFPPALVQAFPRIVSCYLEMPVGPNITRSLTLSAGWKSREGESLSGTPTWPIQCGWIPGGAEVKGRVRKSTGEGIKSTLFYWYQVSVDEGGNDLQTGQPFLDSYYALVSSNIETADDGSFHFDYVPEPAKTAIGPFMLEADTPLGKAFGEASVLGNGQELEFDLVLEGKGDIIGTVTDAAGLPLQNVQVQAWQEQPSYGRSHGGGSSVVETTTDSSGHYKISGLKVGVFSLRFLLGLYGGALSGEIPRDGAVVQMDMKLIGQTGSVDVQVLNPDGTPRANQEVYFGLPSLLRSGGTVNYIYTLSAATDASGHVVFSDIPAGDVSAKIPNVPTPVPLWSGFLKPGESAQVTLRMVDPKQLGWVDISVLDGQGNGVPNAYLWSEQNFSPGTLPPNGHTGLDGHVILPALPDKPYSVWAVHPDWPATGVHSAFVTPGSGQTVLLPVTLPARGFLDGKVTRPDGSPVAQAVVAIPPVTPFAPLNHLTYTDATGAYHLSGLSTTVSNPVLAIGPDLLTRVNKDVPGQPEQTLHLDLVLPFVGNNTLKGQIYQPLDGGTPMPTVAEVQVFMSLPSLSLYGNWGETVETLMGDMLSANSDGSYQFQNLPSASFRVAAHNDIFPIWVQSTGAFDGPSQVIVKDLTLASNATASLEGQITDKDGQTKVGKDVRVILKGGNGGLGPDGLQVLTLDTGRYAFPKAIPTAGTPYTIRVEDPLSGRITVDSIALLQQTNYLKNLRLWGTGNLTLHLQDSLGNPMPEGDVTLSHSRANLLDLTTDLPPLARKLLPADNGTMVFEGLIEGQISVKLRNTAGLVGLGTTEIPQGGGDRDLVVKLQPVGNIRGMLHRADGTAVPAGRVDAYQAGRWLGVSTTRQEATEGLFLFQDLPTGVIQLEAWDPDSRQIGHASITVTEAATANVDITLLDKGLVNILVTQEGQPVEKATVNFNYQGGPASSFSTVSTTDATGKAQFDVPAGTYAVDATDPVTLATGGLNFTRTNNQPAIDLNVTLQAVRTLNVTVIPPPGFTGDLTGWKLRSESGRTVTLDATALAVLPDLPVGTHALTLTDTLERFRGKATAQLTAIGGAVQAAQVLALARGNVDATLLDDHGQPYAGGFVDLPPLPLESGAMLSSGTDTTGKAHFTGVLEGVRAAQGRSSDGLRRAQGSVTLAQENETQTVTLTLSGTGGFEGTLRDGAGTPLPYTAVNCSVGLALATDAQGHFAASQVPLGTWTLSAKGEGSHRVGSRTVTLSQADQVVNADFSLSAAGTLKGVVTDPLRSTLGAVTVTAFLNGGNVGSTMVDGSGAYQLKDVPAGSPLHVRVTMDDGVTSAFEGTATVPGEGQTLDLPITLEPRPNLHGHTYAPGGQITRSMTLRLYDPNVSLNSSLRQEGTSVDHPTYLMTYLTPGVAYILKGFDGTDLVANTTVTLQPSPIQQEFDVISMDMTSVRGKIHRADATLTWPTGTTGRVGGVSVPLDADGTLHLIGELKFAYSDQPLAVDVQVPGSGWWHVADVARVKNGFTELDLAAPAFAPVAITIQNKDGSASGGAAVAIDGVGSGIADANGVWATPVVRAGTYHVRSNSATEVGSGDFTLQTDGQQLNLTFKLGDLVDISGTYTYYYAGTVRFFQAGVQVEGDWWQNVSGFSAKSFTGVLDGLVLKGTWTAKDGSHGKFNITFAPDASSFNGTWGLNDAETGNPWAATKQAGVSVRIKPATASLKTGEVLPFTVLVAGTPNKAVTFTQSGGTISSDGLFTAPMAPGVYTVTATSAADPAQKDMATISVSTDGLPDISGTYNYFYAANLRIFQNGNQVEGDWWQNFASFPNRTFTGTLDGLTVTGTWTDAVGGSGQFAFTFPLDASILDATWGTGASATGNVFHASRVPWLVSVRVKPGNMLLKTGQIQAFTALVAGTYNKAFTWSAIGSGTLTPDGQFTSATAGITTVTATSAVDTTAKGSATVSATADGYLNVDGVFTYGSDVAILCQAGTAITGQWSLSGSHRALNGTLNGYVLTGTWISIEDPTKTGTFTFAFDPAGNVIGGTWGTDGTPAVNTWTATRIAGAVGVFVRPFQAVLPTGSAQDFTAFVAGTSNHSVTWSLDAAVGAVDTNGHYASLLTPGTTAVRASSVAVPGTSGAASVLVRLPITIAPADGIMRIGTLQTFTATMTGFTNPAVTWSSSAGSITSAGVFSAPATPGTVTITATSVEAPSKSATTTVTVRLPITVSPDTLTLQPGQSRSFSVVMTGFTNPSVTWSATGGTIDTQGSYTAPATDGTYTITATSVEDSAQKGTATVTVSGLATLIITVNTADGRPVAHRPLWFHAVGASTEGESSQIVYTDASGVVSFPGLDKATPKVLTDAGGSLTDVWNPRMVDRTLTINQDGTNVLVTLPVGSLTILAQRGTSPVPNVFFQLKIGSVYGTPAGSDQGTGPDGTLKINDVPLNVLVDLEGRINWGYPVPGQATLATGSQTLTLAWPLQSKLTAHLRRANGGAIPAAAPGSDWNWFADPGGDANSSLSGSDPVWMDLPRGFLQTLSVHGAIPVPLDGGTGLLNVSAKGTFTPTQDTGEITLHLPALASVKLAFKDANGQPLSGSLMGDGIQATTDLGCGECTYSRLDLSTFEDGNLPEVFLEGGHTLTFMSQRWGDLGQVQFTVNPSDDGAILIVPVTIPWVKAPYKLKVVAGDHETPVPGAVVTVMMSGGTQFDLPSMATVPADTDLMDSYFWAPTGKTFDLLASFTPRRTSVPVTITASGFTPGTLAETTLELPLTVTRTRLTETDGSDLPMQGLDVRATGDTLPPDPEPVVVLAGKRWAVALGEPVGQGTDLNLFDPDSGLGIKTTASVLALGQHQDVVQALAPHAWLTSATLNVTSPAVAKKLLVGVSKDAPEMVKPEAANWTLRDTGFQPQAGGFTITKDGAFPKDIYNPDPDEVDPSGATTPPGARLFPKVRVPLSGLLWVGERSLHQVSDGATPPNYSYEALPGRFGAVSISLLADQLSTLTAAPLTWAWVTTPLKVQDGSGTALTTVQVLAQPKTAPGLWSVFQANPGAPMDQGGPDSNQIWHPSLPVGIPLRFETMVWSSPWLYGFLDLTPTDPPPAEIPILKGTETRISQRAPNSPEGPRAKKGKSPGKSAPKPSRSSR